jgi:WD40 repeat protein/tRNA A-37 threonylcarbamoyl transferase component Bud32
VQLEDKPKFGKYQLLEQLGAGATAEVYRSIDLTLEREVALKLLKPSLVGDTQAFGRFLQEARGAARLFHPNIATVLEVGESDGRYYIAMRYIPGKSLDKLLAEQGRISWEEALHMAQQIGAALDFAHGQGFLHRDVKPSNIIRTPEGDFVLTDFGLVKAMMATGLTTQTGALLGTPPYMAPEIWLGQPATPATDQYALACVVYEALTGKVLFDGETPPAVMTRHVLQGAEMGEEWPTDATQGVKEVLLKALAKKPTERYATAGEFVEALQGLNKEEDNKIPTRESSGKIPRIQKAIRPSNTAHVMQLVNRLIKHTWSVQCVTFSPDGELLASGSGDNMVRLWRVSDGSLLRTLEGHASSVVSIAFSPDSLLLASGSWDKTVRLWRVSDGALLRTIEGHTNDIEIVTFSPDGRILASGSDENTVYLWRVTDGKLLRTLKGHTDWVWSVAFSPDGEMLASGSFDKTVRLWRVSDGALLRTIEGHTNDIEIVTFSPDGRILASGADDNMVRLWRVADGTLLRTLVGHTDWVRSVAFSPDGELLASGSDDRTVRLWRVSDGKLLCMLEGHKSYVESVAFSPNGELLASGSHDGTIILWGIP